MTTMKMAVIYRRIIIIGVFAIQALVIILITTMTTTTEMTIQSIPMSMLKADAFMINNNNNNRNRNSNQNHNPSLMTLRPTTVLFDQSTTTTDDETENDNHIENDNDDDDNVVDIAIIGAGIGGLTAGAILNTLYNKKVGIYESHYIPGGCAHAFDRVAAIPIISSNGNNNGTTTTSSMKFTFDSGPTILLGCSQEPFCALRQVLDAVNQSVEWIRYDGWGMIENPQDIQQENPQQNQQQDERRWKCELGPNKFQQGPLLKFGGKNAVLEFEELRTKTKDLTVGIDIPAMAMRPGSSALIPLLKYFPTLVKLLSSGPAKLTGTFRSYLDGPDYVVTNKWLRDWLDALAFSLSGLPASRTSAAAMAFVIDDMHRDGAGLDYPKGGLGTVIDALCRGVEHQTNNDSNSKRRSRIHLRTHVDKIDFNSDGSKATGITLSNGKRIIAKEGVICNAPVWTLKNLIRKSDTEALKKLSGIIPINNRNNNPNDMDKNDDPKSTSSSSSSSSSLPLQTWIRGEQHEEKDGNVNGYSIRMTRPSKNEGDSDSDSDTKNSNNNNLLNDCDTAEMTGSFLHLHVAINATGLDLTQMEAHYTVMDRGLCGNADIVVNDIPDGPCGELNMIAVSNPCVIDPTLAPSGYMVLHAYGAGNEPYEVWEKFRNDRNSPEYKQLKEERSAVLWRALESVIPDVRDRIVLDLVGSPLTHERFLRRPRGTYGSATEDYLKDGSTPISNLVLAGDQIFPGIGVPAVAISGASAANAMVNPLRQWICLDSLKELGRI
jgi:phytoene dehydrogenase-like protein